MKLLEVEGDVPQWPIAGVATAEEVFTAEVLHNAPIVVAVKSRWTMDDGKTCCVCMCWQRYQSRRLTTAFND